jgi:outer membrane protein OmpA-like peptidoglycan-associated protein
VNYDFIPGDEPIFVDDFASDHVGDFPRRLAFIAGNMEVAEWSGGRWLRATSNGSQFAIALPDSLPARYTLEFDYTGGDPSSDIFLDVHFSDAPNAQHLHFSPPGNDPPSAGIDRVAMTKLVTSDSAVRHARVLVDGSYAKVYVGSQRLANVPNAKLGRSDSVRFAIGLASPGKPVFVGNIRLAAGGRDLYDALAKEGHVATHGLFFAVGSATIRPESTPTLEKIGEMLKKHADLALEIEGHTDDTGSPEANQKLSEERAAAVRSYLVKSYEISPGRLTTKGFGASKPVASNDTPEGRQQNRRVELVKM